MYSEWVIKLLPELPAPPSELIETLNYKFRPEQNQFSPKNNRHLGIEAVKDWQRQRYEWIQPMASNTNKRQRFSPEFDLWIRKNISLDFQRSNSGVMFFDEPQLPHTDLTRDFVLLYNLDPGGTDTRLCFWQENEKPLFRDRMVTAERGPNLHLIDSVKGPFNQWYLMKTRVLHSVENMTGLRVNLQVSFDLNLPKQFELQYL